MSLPWHTSAAIVVAGGSIALALFFALRTPAPAPGAAASPSRTAAPSHASDDPIAARDHQRRIDELATPTDSSSASTPVPSTPPRTIDASMGAPAEMPGLPAASPQVVTAVTEQARRAFDERRRQIVAKCWNDATEGPDSIELTLALSYDANGRVLASGVTEDRERNRPEVATCVGPLVHDLAIAPPGELVAITVRVTLP